MEKQFGKYVLTGRLGGGGMAEVFRARFKGLGGFEKNVAIKLILPSFSNDPEFVEMFMQEANLSARLDHANIVRIYEFDQAEGRYFIVMELVDGRDLRQIISRCREVGRKLSVPEVLIIGMEMCKGLAFAHGELCQGAPEIIHRDISPHNIIVSGAGEVKITDFGIAKLASASSHTRAGLVKGKVGYMSPEQARGEQVDRRSDIFALGCVLWELFAGQRLFTGDSDQVVLYSLQNSSIKPASYYNPDVTEAVDKLLNGLLERDLDKRFASASAVMTEIEDVMSAYPDVQRGTSLSNLYRELFSGVPERPDTQVMPLHKTVSDQAMEWFDHPAGTAVSDQVPVEGGRTISQPSHNQYGVAVKETMLLDSGQREAVPKRWSPLKGVLIGLGMCLVGALIGAIGYYVWGHYLNPDAGTNDPGKIVAVPAKEKAPPGVAALVDPPTPAPPLNNPVANPESNSVANSTANPAASTIANPATNAAPTAAASRQETPKADLHAEVKPGNAINEEPKKKLPERSGKATSAAPANKGQLLIMTVPPSMVYHGNKLLGQTMLDIALPAGDYTLRLVDKNNKEKSRTVKVTINPGKINRYKFSIQ